MKIKFIIVILSLLSLALSKEEGKAIIFQYWGKSRVLLSTYSFLLLIAVRSVMLVTEWIHNIKNHLVRQRKLPQVNYHRVFVLGDSHWIVLSNCENYLMSTYLAQSCLDNIIRGESGLSVFGWFKDLIFMLSVKLLALLFNALPSCSLSYCIAVPALFKVDVS